LLQLLRYLRAVIAGGITVVTVVIIMEMAGGFPGPF